MPPDLLETPGWSLGGTGVFEEELRRRDRGLSDLREGEQDGGIRALEVLLERLKR